MYNVLQRHSIYFNLLQPHSISFNFVQLLPIYFIPARNTFAFELFRLNRICFRTLSTKTRPAFEPFAKVAFAFEPFHKQSDLPSDNQFRLNLAELILHRAGFLNDAKSFVFASISAPGS